MLLKMYKIYAVIFGALLFSYLLVKNDISRRLWHERIKCKKLQQSCDMHIVILCAKICNIQRQKWCYKMIYLNLLALRSYNVVNISLCVFYLLIIDMKIF